VGIRTPTSPQLQGGGGHGFLLTSPNGRSAGGGGGSGSPGAARLNPMQKFQQQNNQNNNSNNNNAAHQQLNGTGGSNFVSNSNRASVANLNSGATPLSTMQAAHNVVINPNLNRDKTSSGHTSEKTFSNANNNNMPPPEINLQLPSAQHQPLSSQKNILNTTGSTPNRDESDPNSLPNKANGVVSDPHLGTSKRPTALIETQKPTNTFNAAPNGTVITHETGSSSRRENGELVMLVSGGAGGQGASDRIIANSNVLIGNIMDSAAGIGNSSYNNPNVINIATNSGIIFNNKNDVFNNTGENSPKNNLREAMNVTGTNQVPPPPGVASTTSGGGALVLSGTAVPQSPLMPSSAGGAQRKIETMIGPSSNQMTNDGAPLLFGVASPTNQQSRTSQHRLGILSATDQQSQPINSQNILNHMLSFHTYPQQQQQNNNNAAINNQQQQMQAARRMNSMNSFEAGDKMNAQSNYNRQPQMSATNDQFEGSFGPSHMQNPNQQTILLPTQIIDVIEIQKQNIETVAGNPMLLNFAPDYY
jgi:hypothetical protein